MKWFVSMSSTGPNHVRTVLSSDDGDKSNSIILDVAAPLPIDKHKALLHGERLARVLTRMEASVEEAMRELYLK